MSKAIVCVYTAPVFGAITVAALQAQVAAVPLDLEVIYALGLQVISDITAPVIGPPAKVVRTITLGMGPGLGNPGPFDGVAAAITANLQLQEADGAPIKDYTITVNGESYTAVPFLQVSDSGGGKGAGATAQAILGVTGVIVLGAATTPYTGATRAVAVGGQLAKDGKQATFGPPTVIAGAITVIPILDAGGPYNSPPQIVITDTGGGAGQSAVALLGIVKVIPHNPGEDYTSPVVTVVPYFKNNTPDAFPMTQGSTVADFMELFLKMGTFSGFQAAIPTITP